MKKYYCFLSLLILLSSSAWAQSPFTYENLVEIIRSKHLKSVEETLPYFPPEMRSNFTLVYDSFSLQKSSFQYPRSIMFGTDAKFTCTFGGHKTLEGFESLECYQFRDNSKTFDFREIAFPTEENLLKEAAFSLPNQRALSNTSCTMCHSKDPHPIWENYPEWPGVYGSIDDSYNQTAFKIIKQEDSEKLKLELESLLQFKKTVSSSTRYRHLEFSGWSKVAPYSESFKSKNLSARPNFRFTSLLKALMVERNHRLIRNLPKAEYLRQLKHLTCDDSEAQAQSLGRYFSAFDWTPTLRTLSGHVGNKLAIVGGFDFSDGYASLNLLVSREAKKSLFATGELNDIYEWNSGRLETKVLVDECASLRQKADSN